MCGKCEPMMAKVSCGSLALGVLCVLLGVVVKLAHTSILAFGPRSFAIGAGLLLLTSIAINTGISYSSEDKKGH